MTEYTAEDTQLVAQLRNCTDDQITEWFIAHRDYLERENAEQQKHVAPYVKKMGMLNNELHRRLIERNPNYRKGMKASASTAYGTFFLKTTSSIKMADREAFRKFLVDVEAADVAAAMALIEDRLAQFMTAHVAKEAVEEYQKENGDALPPGLSSEDITVCQVRKT